MTLPPSTAGPACPGDDPRPLPPPEPDLDACCGQGCEPCILDLQIEAQQRHRAELAAWQRRQAARAAPRPDAEGPPAGGCETRD